MPVSCTYHPGENAVHTCSKCQANFCRACIIVKKSEVSGVKKNYYLCPKCNIYTEPIPFTDRIEPFWKRFPQIFQYPLYLHSVLLILVLSVLQVAFAGFSWTGLIVQLVCLGVLLTYANLVLYTSSHGNLRPPDFEVQTISANFSIVFKQMAIYIIFAVLGYNIATVAFPIIGPGATVGLLAVYILGLMFLLPAIIIMLAVTKSLFAAILPHVFILLAWRIGWPYLALCFFLILLSLAPAAAANFLNPIIPPKALWPIVTILSAYYMIVSYHLMGYILFQYHERVGYKVDFDGEQDTASLKPGHVSPVSPGDDEKSQLLNRVNIFIKDGDYDSAVTLIERDADGHDMDPVIAERYYHLLKLTERFSDMASFGRYYLRQIQKTGHAEKIAEVFLDGRGVNPAFISDDADLLYLSAKSLNETGQSQPAVSAFLEFAERYPDHPLIPNAYFFTAKLLHEKLDNGKQALRVLQHLVEKYPFHENAGFVQSYLRQVKSALNTA